MFEVPLFSHLLILLFESKLISSSFLPFIFRNFKFFEKFFSHLLLLSHFRLYFAIELVFQILQAFRILISFHFILFALLKQLFPLLHQALKNVAFNEPFLWKFKLKLRIVEFWENFFFLFFELFDFFVLFFICWPFLSNFLRNFLLELLFFC